MLFLICFLSTGCQHRLYPFPDEGLLCALMCVHLIFCVQTKMFFIDYASEEDKILYLWKILGDVLCVLDCIVENVP